MLGKASANGSIPDSVPGKRARLVMVFEKQAGSGQPYLMGMLSQRARVATKKAHPLHSAR